MQNRKNTKTLKLITVIAVIIAVMALMYGYGQRQLLNRQNYAIENDCKWHESKYPLLDPVCK